MKIKAKIKKIKVISPKGEWKEAELTLDSFRGIFKGFGKFKVSKSISGKILRSFRTGSDFKKGEEVILTDTELCEVFYPVDFNDKILIPDASNFIETTVIVRSHRNLDKSYITILNSRKKEIAKLFLDDGISSYDISFRITKADFGPVYIKELGKDFIAYIAKPAELNKGIKFEGDVFRKQEKYPVLSNDYLMINIDCERGAGINSIAMEEEINPFFSFFALYSKTDKVSFPSTDMSVKGKEIPDSSGKKFKKVLSKSDSCRFEFKKKGFTITKNYSFLKELPVLVSLYEIAYGKKKDFLINPYFNSVFNFGPAPNTRYFIPGLTETYEELFSPEVKRYWSELRYSNQSVVLFGFADHKTDDIIIQVYPAGKNGEMTLGHNDNCIVINGNQDEKKLTKSHKVSQQLFTIQGRLIYKDDNFYILNKGHNRKNIFKINFKKENKNTIKSHIQAGNKKIQFRAEKLFPGFTLYHSTFSSDIKDVNLVIGKKRIKIGD